MKPVKENDKKHVTVQLSRYNPEDPEHITLRAADILNNGTESVTMTTIVRTVSVLTLMERLSSNQMTRSIYYPLL